MTRELLWSWTKDDFTLDWFSGTGAGGQHRNKHQNCLRLTHNESGIKVTAQNFRSRDRNLKDAMYRMGELLREKYAPTATRPREPVTEIVRTYNIAENRVVDAASGEKSLWDNMNMDAMIMARKKALLTDD